MISRAFTNKLFRARVASGIFFLARLSSSYPRLKMQEILSRNISPAKYYPLTAVLLIGAFLRFFIIKELFPFDYDQMVPAEAAYDFIVNHKLSLIGQELSFEGFFLGPLHSWIQFIPYAVCRLMPDCVPYFYAILGLITSIIFYLVIRKIIDSKVALIAAAIYLISFSAISTEIGANSNYFLFLSSIGVLFCLYKYFSGGNKYLPVGALIAGLATVNFNPVFLFSTLAYFSASFARERKHVKIYALSLGAFLINYLPLFVFNLRHDNLILHSLKNFASQSVGSINYFEKAAFLLKDVLIPFYSNFLFQNTSPFFLILTQLLIILGTYFSFNSKSKILFFLPFWIMTTFLGFIFYKGHIPDYYFLQIVLPFIIIVSISLRKNILLLLFVTALFAYSNFSRFINAESSSGYKIKKEIVSYVINDSSPKTFNVYYQIPMGLNTGYGYLFKVLGKNPQEGGENLYILELINPNQFDITKYLKNFKDKKVSIKLIGFMHIISVK